MRIGFAVPAIAKRTLRPFAAPDPVALQQLEALRPVEAVEFVDQALGIGGDAQHPLAHRARYDRKAADLALAVDDFFVGQHGAELGAPVHRRLSDVGEPHAVGVVAPRYVAIGSAFCVSGLNQEL